MKFDEFKLNEALLEGLSYMGFEKATVIQEQAIPQIMQNRDLIACAQTGTGKTAAFVLPILHKLATSERTGVNTLIIAPTRELAIQIEQQIQGFSYFVNANSVVVYGGGDGSGWDKEKKALTSDTDIVVATPGKLIAHLKMGYVKLDKVEHLILDEADKMLDMGFLNDIQKIISHIPEKRQTLMFSATMPAKIRQLSKQILKNPVEISIEMSKPAEGVLQAAYLTFDAQKTPLISTLIEDKPDFTGILIFTSTKSKVSEILRALKRKGHAAEGISSDLEQNERNEVLTRFRSKQTRILVATDVLSRGIDIKDINLIINYDVPGDAEDYVHRVGRTARGTATGIAITLINEKDMGRFKRIEELIERKVLKIPLPTELGDGPEWNTKSTFDRRGFKPKQKGKKWNNKDRRKK
ncbi:MAG: DEAD/DEAH box helicase [Bacteroidales bacterium]|nr:DEAD/DEAH box helicase [Bacteroidales bacterium]MCF8402414.1 DEAD/DEAH box helicase [Bacteroidales bacterium]